jgi:hypothetical protein
MTIIALEQIDSIRVFDQLRPHSRFFICLLQAIVIYCK